MYNTLFNAINKIREPFNFMKDDFIYFRGNKIGNLGRKRFYELIRSCELPLATESILRKK